MGIPSRCRTERSPSELCGLQLGGELIHSGDVVERGQIGVAGGGGALLAVHQDLDFQNAGSVGRDGMD